jgi:sugar O-acyltransferase (sialic acid O-acetyltransferase NeuD family)
MLVGIVGCGGFGREVMPALKETFERAGITRATLVFVETNPTSRDFVNGYPVMSEQHFLSAGNKQKWFNIAIADSRIREAIAARFIDAGARPIAIRSLEAKIYGESEIREGGIFCTGSIITANSVIGRFFHGNFQSYVAHDCVIGDFVTFAPRVTCNGNVTIEDHAYIGAGAVIKQGTSDRPLRIGKGAVVGMGAVVTRDVPAAETWVGNPARLLERKVNAG